jgi:DNA-binding transcriptional LysR family regulator
MLDAHQLNVFLVAAETLNFTRAAERLHMTQPSVSQHIQSLEKHFGVELFIRTGRHIELSDSGLALVPMARAMVEQSIRTEEIMASLKGGIFGRLTVGCSTTPGKYVLPHLLTRFHHLHPRVQVTCQVIPQMEASKALVNGDIHLALTSLPEETPLEVEYVKFLSDPVCLIAPLSHPWSTQGEILPDALLDEPFIMREESSGTFKVVAGELAKKGIDIKDLNTILTLGNSEAIALAVQEGLGLGFISQIVEKNLVRGRVAALNICGMDIQREIYLGQNIRRPATAAQAAFWEFVQNTEPVNSLLPTSMDPAMVAQ